jgi:hypothetical protein
MKHVAELKERKTKSPFGLPHVASNVVFTHFATVENIVSNTTYIDFEMLNGNQDAIILVTPNLNPKGAIGVLNSHPVGVWYDVNRKQWAIINEDTSKMHEGLAFNIYATVYEDPFVRGKEN